MREVTSYSTNEFGNVVAPFCLFPLPRARARAYDSVLPNGRTRVAEESPRGCSRRAAPRVAGDLLRGCERIAGELSPGLRKSYSKGRLGVACRSWSWRRIARIKETKKRIGSEFAELSGECGKEHCVCVKKNIIEKLLFTSVYIYIYIPRSHREQI